MLEVLRQRRWLGFSAFVVAMLALCVVLANWQWNRYQQRTQENEALDTALSAPTTPIEDLLEAQPAGSASDGSAGALPDGAQWRMVTATGLFDPAAEVAVRRRPLDGRTGFWIVTPLVTDSGTVLVNRGWAPAGRDATTAPEVAPPPAGAVTVTGRLRAPERTTQADPPPAGQAWAADPEVLVSSGDRYDAYVELRTAEPAAAEGLTVLADPGHRGLNNLVYSVQWLIFATVGIVGWWRLIRQESRREPDDEVGAAGPPDRDADPPAQQAAGSELSPDTRPAG